MKIHPKFGRFLVSALGLFALHAGCGKKIGDECRTNIACSNDAERICDISQPGGYCTIDGCDEGSCPEEAVCVRFVPRLFFDQTCRIDVPEDCKAADICLPTGVCAPRDSERRYCVLGCGDNGDCRGGYECRLAGSDGSIPLVAKPGNQVRFCA